MSSAFYLCENRWRDLKWRCPHILCHRRRCYWMSQSSKEVRILVIKFTSKLLEIMVQVCITSCYSIPLSTMVFCCLSCSLGIKFTVGLEFYKGSYICKSHDWKRFHFNAKNIHYIGNILYSPNLNFARTLFSLLEMTYYSKYLTIHNSLWIEIPWVLKGHSFLEGH